METRRRDGPPAREYDEIPYDRRERCLFNPFVQRDGIVLRGGCLTIPASGHTNMFSSTKRGRVELNGERERDLERFAATYRARPVTLARDVFAGLGMVPDPRATINIDDCDFSTIFP